MSFQVKNVFTRPDAFVVFHMSVVPDAYVQHVLETYKNTGKISDIVTEVSPDGLSLNIVWTWISEAEFNTFSNDPVIVAQRESRNAYNAANGITMVQTTATV